MNNKSLKTNAVLNTIRQSLTILFPLITFPYVSRVLGTEEFGKYTFSASVVTYFQLFAAFGINIFAIREGAAIREDRKRVEELASDLFTINIITCTIAYVILALLVLTSPKINSYASLIFIHSMCMILTMFGMDWINNVYEDFLYITIRYIVIQIIALISIFLFVRSNSDTAIYCLILVFGSYGGNLINFFYIRRYIDFPKPKKIEVKKYLIPLLILFVNSLATTIYVNSDVTMIGIFLDDHQVGLYSFASKIYNILKYFINAAVIVSIPRLAAVVNGDKKLYSELIEKILYALIIFLLPLATGLFMLSKPIIMIAGGQEYIEGYSTLMVLAFSLVFALLGSICTNCILIIQKMEKKVLISTIISALVNVLLNFVLISTVGIIGAAITTLLAEVVNLFIQFYFSKKEAHISLNIIWNDVFVALVGVAEVIIACVVATKIWNADSLINSAKIVGLSVITSGIFYMCTLFISNNRLVVSLVNKKKG